MLDDYIRGVAQWAKWEYGGYRALCMSEHDSAMLDDILAHEINYGQYKYLMMRPYVMIHPDGLVAYYPTFAEFDSEWQMMVERVDNETNKTS